jgi:hypothetical protein
MYQLLFVFGSFASHEFVVGNGASYGSTAKQRGAPAQSHRLDVRPALTAFKGRVFDFGASGAVTVQANHSGASRLTHAAIKASSPARSALRFDFHYFVQVLPERLTFTM